MHTFGIKLYNGVCCRHTTSDKSCIPSSVYSRAFIVVDLDTGEIIKNRMIAPLSLVLPQLKESTLKSKLELALS